MKLKKPARAGFLHELIFKYAVHKRSRLLAEQSVSRQLVTFLKCGQSSLSTLSVNSIKVTRFSFLVK
jgi:hypothetical protein